MLTRRTEEVFISITKVATTINYPASILETALSSRRVLDGFFTTKSTESSI
jgi:hypothetical protein